MAEGGPFAHAVEHAERWLAAYADPDRRRGWMAIRAVLQAIRDQLTHAEAAHFAAQLPMLFRGAFYEGWRPAETPKRAEDVQAFVESVEAHLPPGQQHDLDAVLAVQEAVAALARCGMGPELAHVRGLLPKAVQEVWVGTVGER